MKHEFIYLATFLQRFAIVGGLLWFLTHNPDHNTAWTLLGAAVADLFHAAKNGTKNSSS